MGIDYCGLSSPLTSEEMKDAYVESFDLTGDPRPPGYRWILPAGWFIPNQRARDSDGACYRYLGAAFLRRQLKKMSCYPRPIHGTRRHTHERERALILTIPLTIKYEFGHVWAGTAHFSIVSALLLRAIFVRNDDLVDYIVWGAQYILIYFLHVFPCFVQRLNRAQLYAALEEFRLSSTNSQPRQPLSSIEENVLSSSSSDHRV